MSRIQWPVFVWIACVSLCAAARVDEPARAEEARPAPVMRTGEERIRRALRQPTGFDFIDTSLGDCLHYLQEYHEARIWVNETALSAAGVAIDTPVTLSLSGVTLEAALDILLKPLNLDFMIEDDVLKVTTAAQVSETFQLEIYSVRELLDGGFTPEELNELLKSSVSPPSWDNGQTALRIARGNLLVVRQSPRIQRELVRALEKLRAKSRTE